MMRGNKLLLAMTALTVWGFSGMASAAPFFTESFDNVPGMFTGGNPWAQNNLSNPPGAGTWSQYTTTTVPVQTLPFIYADFDSVSDAGIISNWLISPTMTFESGDKIEFFTRTEADSEFADNLQVRLSTNGTSTNVGTTESSVGDFTTLLLEVNPPVNDEYDPNGYPHDWFKYTLTVPTLNEPTQGRLAFRYYVMNGGPNGENSMLVALDTLTVEHVPEPTSLVMGAGAVGFALLRRRRTHAG
jgi:hypothetical protein